jgi:hypothetical protein
MDGRKEGRTVALLLYIPSQLRWRGDNKFLPHNILVNTRINILQWILTKLGTYLVLRRVWNLLIFKVIGQGNWVNFLPCNILVNTRGQNPLKDVDSSVHKDVMW